MIVWSWSQGEETCSKGGIVGLMSSQPGGGIRVNDVLTIDQGLRMM